jgi:hypothetical protein
LGGGTHAVAPDDQFFLLISVPNPSGLDPSYLFDSRPLAMTQAGAIQNYRGTEPKAWTGTNGVSTLATELTSPLEPFRSSFSVINGVVMAAGFDGHDQNFNHLFTGNAFGGDSFIPHLNLDPHHRPLDAIQRGRIKATLDNANSTVPLTAQTGAALVRSLSLVPGLDPGSALFKYLLSRFGVLAAGDGSFSLGSATMRDAFSQTPALAGMLSQVKFPAGSTVDTIENFIAMMAQVFRVGAARSAILTLSTGADTLDTHDVKSCSEQPRVIGSIAAQLAQTLQALSNTPYDQTRSLADVTTFMFSAEFGRTLKQYGKPVDQTGTDHNPIGNSVLLGGKGIRGGLVLGSTDFQSATETLSKAHIAMDPGKVKAVGRPYDFASGTSRTDLPDTWQTVDYLGFNSIVNTIYSLFGAPQSRYRAVERNGPIAQVVPQLLA